MAKRDSQTYYERDKALYREYLKARNAIYEAIPPGKEIPNGIHSKAILQAMHAPQNRFWITQDRMYRILLALVKGGKRPKTWATRVPMQQEIIDTYNRVKDKRMFRGMSLRFISSFLTCEPTSGFFMSFSRAKRAIRRQFIEEKMKHRK